MSKLIQHLLNLAIPLGLSFVGIGVSTTLLLNGWSDTPADIEKPSVGRVISKGQSAQIKGPGRSMWQDVAEGDDLFDGHEIRATHVALLQLAGGISIELEPEAVCQIGPGPVVNITGDFFASGTPESVTQKLQVKTQGVTAKLGDNAFSVVKDRSGTRWFQTHRGEVSVLTDTGKSLQFQPDKTGIFENAGLRLETIRLIPTEPKFNEITYSSGANSNVFQWKPIDDRYQVSLEIGRTIRGLERIAHQATGQSGKIQAKVPSETFYWRLRAQSDDPSLSALQGPIVKSRAKEKIPPVALYPANGETVVLGERTPELKLRWSNPSGLKGVVVELATLPNFEDRVIYYPKQEGQQIIKPTNQGDFYWRVSGFLASSHQALSSQVQKFSFKTRPILRPPLLKLPAPGEFMSLEIVQQTGLSLAWENPPGIKRFQVTVQKTEDTKDNKTVLKKESELSHLRLDSPTPGTYRWFVQALNNEGSLSQPSEIRTFTVQDLPSLAWADMNSTYLYVSEKPSLAVSWQRDPASVSEWRVRVRPRDNPSETGQWQTVKEPRWETQVPQDGDYVAEVEAVDPTLKVLAKTPPRNIFVKAKALLPPPDFAADLPSELSAPALGPAQVLWLPVVGANHYLLQIKTPSGDLTREIKFQGDRGWITQLMPGHYLISLRSVDESGRVGPAGVDRNLTIKEGKSIESGNNNGGP